MKYQKANIYHLIAVFSLFIIQFSILNSQDTWVRTYQPFGNDVSYEVEDIRICPDSGYAVIGTVRYDDWDVAGFMMKTDSEGNLLWANIDSVDFIPDPQPSGFVVLEDGSFITAGNNYWSTEGHYLLKRNPQGGIEWTQQLDNEFTLQALELTNDGDIITTGSSTYNTIFLEKLDLNGNLIWRRYYLPEGFTYGGGYSVTQTSDGGYALTGVVNGPDNWDVLVLKTDSNGDSLWTWTYDGYGLIDGGNCIVNTYDDNFLVCGFLNYYSPIYQYGFLGKFDLFGNCIFNFQFEPWHFRSCLQDDDNDFVLYSGYSLIKINDYGDTLWCNGSYYWGNVGDRSFQKDENYFLSIKTIGQHAFIEITKSDSVGEVTKIEDGTTLQTLNSFVFYPNPVRSSLNISYILYEPSNVEIDLYNVKGQFIDRILNDNYLIGKHSINRDIINYPSGLYYIHYKTDKQAETKKITIIR